MAITYAKSIPLSDVHDILLKMRSEFSAQCRLWIQQSEQDEIKAMQFGRHEAAQECRAEQKAFADAEYVFLKIIDRELKGTVKSKG